MLDFFSTLMGQPNHARVQKVAPSQLRIIKDQEFIETTFVSDVAKIQLLPFKKVSTILKDMSSNTVLFDNCNLPVDYREK